MIPSKKIFYNFSWLKLALSVSILFGVYLFPSFYCLAEDAKPIKLRVALYPYVPQYNALFKKIEAVFERKNPGVDLVLVDDQNFLQNYYAGGLQKCHADVYEIDTVLLSDMIALGKITPIELPNANFSLDSLDAVKRQGKTWGAPHWLCGLLFFYQKGHPELDCAKNWQEVNAYLKKHHKTLLVDFKGASTLGEWYFSALTSMHGLEQAQKSILQGCPTNSEVTRILAAILDNCPSGFGRSKKMHKDIGFYPRSFVMGKALVYVGYSESMHYGLQFAIDNHTTSKTYLKQNQIAVRKMPAFFLNKQHKTVGWLDALALGEHLKGPKKELAMRFISFMVSSEAYRIILEPDKGQAPRYLLPAVEGLKIKGAPLYKELMPSITGIQTGTAPGLNRKLHKIGKELDNILPSESGEK